MNLPDVHDSEYYITANNDTRLHPYSLFKRTNAPTTDTVTVTEAEDGKTLRTVIIRNGNYEVWVKQRAADDHPTHITDADRITPTEFDAITLKHDAATNAPNIDSAALLTHLTHDDPSVQEHAVTALTYVAREAPKTCTHTVPHLEELIKEHTDTTIARWAVETLAHIAKVAPETVAPAIETVETQTSHHDYWARIKAREVRDAIKTTETAIV